MKGFKILVIAVFSALFIQCSKDDSLVNEANYNFKTVINVDYKADTISMGDTLWLDSEIVGFLVDSATQQNIYFRDASINLNLLVRAWNVGNQTYQPDQVSVDFRTYASYLSYTNKATMIGLYYYKFEGKYLMRLGIIFHNSGVYSVDADYLKFQNYYNNTEQNFGGGIMEFYTLEGEYKNAYLKGEIKTENNNIHLYNDLSETDKNSFQIVDEHNRSKYFFIKVNESSDEN